MTDVALTATPPIRAARVYLRVSTEEQDLARQEAIVAGVQCRRGLPREGIGRAPGPA